MPNSALRDRSLFLSLQSLSPLVADIIRFYTPPNSQMARALLAGGMMNIGSISATDEQILTQVGVYAALQDGVVSRAAAADPPEDRNLFRHWLVLCS